MCNRARARISRSERLSKLRILEFDAGDGPQDTNLDGEEFCHSAEIRQVDFRTVDSDFNVANFTISRSRVD